MGQSVRFLPRFVWRVHDYIDYRLPAVPRGILDYWYYRPDMLQPFGGAFNGQRFRRLMFNELLTLFEFDLVVETGSYTGCTTAYIDEHVNCPIYSVELNPRYFTFSKLRLRGRKDVSLVFGDSRKFLREAALSSAVSKGCAFFYLDAHWNDDLPLADELHTILDTWDNPIIMIDDFRVPGDDGYRFDDYGPEKVLEEAYLAQHGILERSRAFYPAAPSGLESGLKRGCVVLARRESCSEPLLRAHSLRQKPI